MSEATQTKPAKRTRFEEFDIGRAVAILGLPVVHVLEEGDALGLYAPGFVDAHVFLLALSALGAPLFMACMGANMVFTRHATPRELARRGVMLLVMGVLLNVARFGLPDLIFGSISGQHLALEWWPLEVAGCDIYDFAGLCFLAFALFKKLDLKPSQILGVAAVSLVMGAYVLPHFFATPEETYLTRFLGRIFWINEYSSFPLLTWLSFPALGYAFGSWFLEAGTDEARRAGLRRMMLGAAMAFAAAAGFVVASGGDVLLVYASPANDYITDIPNVMLVGSTLVFVAAGVHRLATALQGSRVLGWFVNVSRGIIPYYTCQWVVIGWLEIAIGDLGLEEYCQLNELSFWLVGIAVMLVSLAVSRGWLALKARMRARR